MSIIQMRDGLLTLRLFSKDAGARHSTVSCSRVIRPIMDLSHGLVSHQLLAVGVCQTAAINTYRWYITAESSAERKISLETPIDVSLTIGSCSCSCSQYCTVLRSTSTSTRISFSYLVLSDPQRPFFRALFLGVNSLRIDTRGRNGGWRNGNVDPQCYR